MQKKFRIRIKGFEKKKASAFKFNPLNYRRHGDAQRDALRTMLGDVGWVQGVIENKRTGNLIDGHARIEEALRDDPNQPVPYLVVDLSEAEEKAVLATLDPIGAMAEVDPEILDQLYNATVADMPQLEDLLAQLHHEPNGNGADPPGTDDRSGELVDKAVTLQKKWKVKAGQIWEIGHHRMLCGSATDRANVARVMSDQRAALCFTSPPYAQQRDYGDSAKKEVLVWDDLMTGVFGSLVMRTDGQLLVNLGLVHREREWVPYWDRWIEWMRSQGWRRFGWYVWDQGPGLPGEWNGRAAPSHEFVFHFNRESRALNKTIECTHAGEINAGHGLRNKDGTVANYSHVGLPIQTHRVIDSVIRLSREKFGHVNTGRGIQAVHPAPYPVSLPSHFIPAFTNRQEVIYDPFLGSGTTLVAAQHLDRVCVGVEIEPKFCAVVLERAALLFPQLQIKRART